MESSLKFFSWLEVFEIFDFMLDKMANVQNWKKKKKIQFIWTRENFPTWIKSKKIIKLDVTLLFC